MGINYEKERPHSGLLGPEGQRKKELILKPTLLGTESLVNLTSFLLSIFIQNISVFMWYLVQFIAASLSKKEQYIFS